MVCTIDAIISSLELASFAFSSAGGRRISENGMAEVKAFPTAVESF